MKVYEAVFREGETEGVYALSVVENPAMQDMWITLNEHPKQVSLSAVDNDKRLLLGAALIPNKRIYRNIEGNEFEMFFTEETIEKVAHNFFKQGNQNNSSLEHEIALEGMSVVEAWIVEDPKNDKSNSYGKEYEKGTWVTMMKVDNDEVWQKAKSGEIKGFSIDALLGLQEIKLNTEIEMSKVDLEAFGNSLIEKAKNAFNFSNSKEQEVTEEVVEAQAETTEEVTEEDNDFDKEAFMKDFADVLAQFSANVKSEIEAVKTEFSGQLKDKEKEVEDLKVELSKQPEVEALNTNPVEVQVELTAKGSILELMRNNK